MVGNFKKFDNDKPSLLKIWRFKDTLIEAIEVVEFGDAKYGECNWNMCKEPHRYLEAVQRHIASHAQGEIMDKESGKRHVAHALSSLMMYMELTQEGITK